MGSDGVARLLGVKRRNFVSGVRMLLRTVARGRELVFMVGCDDWISTGVSG